jgi:hypothetical protein
LPNLLITLLALVLLPSSAMAATVEAQPASETIAIGASTTIAVNLVLAPLEDASLFELTIDLAGSGTTVANVMLTPCAGWAGLADGTLSASEATVSCTSGAENQTGTLLSAELAVTGLALGSFEIMLGSDSFAQRDTDTFPFVEDVPLLPVAGTVLATVTMPEPRTALLQGIALVALAGVSWRARRREVGQLELHLKSWDVQHAIWLR